MIYPSLLAAQSPCLLFRQTSVVANCIPTVYSLHGGQSQNALGIIQLIPAVCMHSRSVTAMGSDEKQLLTQYLTQLREAEEQGLLVRSLVSASAAAGKLAIGQGASCAILDLPGSSPAAPGAASSAALVAVSACRCLAGQGKNPAVQDLIMDGPDACMGHKPRNAIVSPKALDPRTLAVL